MAESLSIETRLSTTTARVGDLIGLEVVVRHPAFIQVGAPVIDKTLGSFEVFGSTMAPREQQGDIAVSRFQAQLQNFTTGQQLLPSIPIPYTDPMNKAYRAQSASTTVTIQTVPLDPKLNGDIKGIRGVIGPTAWSLWWWVFAVALIAALGFLLWRKRQRVLEGPPPPPPEPADDKALRRLKELFATGWIESGKLKEFYSALSDITRGYLEDAFQTKALERTTSELMRDLRKKSDIPADQQIRLKDLLEMCDLVKFAKFRPDAQEATADYQKALAFIEAVRTLLIKDDEPPPPARPKDKGRPR